MMSNFPRVSKPEEPSGVAVLLSPAFGAIHPLDQGHIGEVNA